MRVATVENFGEAKEVFLPAWQGFHVWYFLLLGTARASDASMLQIFFHTCLLQPKPHLVPLFNEIVHNVFVKKNWTKPASNSALKYTHNNIICMARLYFLGGENVAKRDAAEINDAAFRDASEAPAVVVFAWASGSFDKTYKSKKRLFDYFKSLGACNVDFVDYSDTYEEISRKVEYSDLIYLPGGLASVLVKRLKNKNVDTLLRGYDGVVVGRSAGALALGKKCVVTKNRRHPTSQMIWGIGLVNFSVKAHYKHSKDNALKRLSKQETIYAIPERSALVYEKGCLSFMGNVYLFQNGEKTIAD